MCCRIIVLHVDVKVLHVVEDVTKLFKLMLMRYNLQQLTVYTLAIIYNHIIKCMYFTSLALSPFIGKRCDIKHMFTHITTAIFAMGFKHFQNSDVLQFVLDTNAPCIDTQAEQQLLSFLC